MSYTLARLPVPAAVWDLIADKLRAAGYDHVFHGGTIDLTHIGLEVEPPRSGPLTASMDNLLAWRMGEACAAAAAETKIGDPIDRGLVLLRELVGRGLDVVVNEPRGASYPPAGWPVPPIRHYVETDGEPVEIQTVTFVHEGGGPHRSCSSCLAVVDGNRRLVHSAGCRAVRPLEAAP